MKYIMNIKVKIENNASVKPRNDIVEILEHVGWKPLCIYNLESNYISRHFEMFCSFIKLKRLRPEDVLMIQWPFQLLNPFKKIYLENHLACKKILFIHDVQSLRMQDDTYPEIDRFNQYDLIITHTEAFKHWLEKNGIYKPIIINKIFDYKLSNKIERPFVIPDKYRIVFSGNLNKRKSGFLYLKLKAKKYTLELYGDGFTGKIDSVIHYNGVFSPEEIVYKLEGEFGLVWDGDSIDGCSGAYGEYMKYNCPYKCAMYIAAQLPIIIWSKAAMAKFVEDNKIGILVDSLNEIDNKLTTLTIAQYTEMKNNIKIIQDRIINGRYTIDFINHAMEYII